MQPPQTGMLRCALTVARLARQWPSLRLLRRRFGEVRNLAVKTHPRLGTRRPYVQHRRERRTIVQRRKSNRRELRVRFALGKQRRAALRAERASRELSTARTNGESLRSSRNFKVGTQHPNARGKGSAARTLAVTAMAVQHGDGCTGASEADRAAGAPSGKGVHGSIIRKARKRCLLPTQGRHPSSLPRRYAARSLPLSSIPPAAARRSGCPR